jgi:hypothetical protein
MSAIGVERRRYQRITLSRPVAGKMGPAKVFVIDLSIIGARIAHQEELPKHQTFRLSFDWQGEEIIYDCEVVRTVPDGKPVPPGGRPVFQSGLRLLRGVGGSAVALRNLIGEHVMRALDEQKANAKGIPPLAATFQSGVKKETNFIVYRYVRNQWQKTSSANPQQPLDGFTVSQREDPMQVDLLCKTYETSDLSGRKMIRAMAELSLSASEAVPTRKYKP